MSQNFNENKEDTQINLNGYINREPVVIENKDKTMSNLLGSKESELKAIEDVYEMAIESLDPENFEALELAFKELLKTRRLTSININN